MSLQKSIKRLFHFNRGPSCLGLFKAAQRYVTPVQLFFLGGQRQMKNVPCRVLSVDRTGVTLSCPGRYPAGSLVRERCSAYFKLPPEAYARLSGLNCERACEGFLCQTRIMDSRLQGSGHSLLRLRLPRQWCQRELRHYKRHRITPACLEHIALWLPVAGLPKALPAPDTASFSSPGKPSCLSLVDLSVAGAMIQLDAVELTDELANMDVKHVLLALNLRTADTTRTRYLAIFCRCVESLYNIPLRRLVLRLAFCHFREGEEMDWQPCTAGIASLADWLERDHPVLTGSVQNPVSSAG